jgi:diguanylate cyclase (GGDEF)-like protein
VGDPDPGSAVSRSAGVAAPWQGAHFFEEKNVKTVRAKRSPGRIGRRLMVESAGAAFLPLLALAVWLQRQPGIGPDVLAALGAAALLVVAGAVAVAASHAMALRRQLGAWNEALRELLRQRPSVRPCVPTRDELGSTSRALNRLGERHALRQSIDDVLAQIDEALLIKPDKRSLIGGALQCLGFVTKGEVLAFALFESQGDSNLGVYLARKSRSKKLEHLRLEIEPDLAHRLRTARGFATRDSAPFPEELANRIYKDSGVQHFFVLPIQRGGRPWGFLISAHKAPTAFARTRLALLDPVRLRLVAGFRSAEREELLHSLAFVDKLTGLPNLATFESTVRQALAGRAADDPAAAVLIVDIDRFKQVNDSFGGATGDRLLIEARHRIGVHLGERDLLARIGGDEFAVFLAHAPESRQAAALARKIIQSLGRSVNIEGQRIYAGASVGIARVPADGTDATQLLKKAEIAMYRAKAEGRSRLVFYAGGMLADSRRRSRLDLELRRAVQRGELLLRIEPRFALAGGVLCGVEAQLAWQHPQRGLLAGSDFLEDAEAIGLAPLLGGWIIEEVCRQHQRWRAAGMVVPQVACHLQGGQLARSGFAAAFKQIAADTTLPAGVLQIEVSGALLAERGGHVEASLASIGAAGATVTVADFGGGSAPIAGLTSPRVGHLKVDIGLLEQHATTADSVPTMIEGLVGLAHAMHKRVVACAVERPEQLRLLKSLGCDEVQGPVMHRVRSLEDFEQKFFQRRSRPAPAPAAPALATAAPPSAVPALPAHREPDGIAEDTQIPAVPLDEDLLEAQLTVPLPLSEDYPLTTAG